MKAEYSGHIDITLMNVFERLENITLYKVSKAGKVKKKSAKCHRRCTDINSYFITC